MSALRRADERLLSSVFGFAATESLPTVEIGLRRFHLYGLRLKGVRRMVVDVFE